MNNSRMPILEGAKDYTVDTSRPGAAERTTITLPSVARRQPRRVLLAARWLRQGVYLTPANAYAAAMWSGRC